jgi:glucan-binding repeat-containing protein
MRKKIGLLVLGSIAALCLSCTVAFAETTLPVDEAVSTSQTVPSEDETSFAHQVSPEDIVLVTSRASSVGLAPPQMVEVLRGHNGEVTFLMGLSDSYYIIVGRNSATIYEFAEGPSPYDSWAENAKYYGGFGSYIVDAGSQLIDALTGQPVSLIPYLEILDQMESTTGSGQSLSPLAASSAMLPWVYDYAQRLSFGLNEEGDPMAGTCTAVAVGQILNYLDRTVDSRILATGYHAETLVQSGQTYYSWKLSYTNTANLQSHLVNNCAMRPVTYGEGVNTGVLLYAIKNSGAKDAGFRSEGVFFNWSKTVSDIDRGIPVLVTTPPFIASDPIYLNNDYDAHSMAVFGYYTNGSDRYLDVHSGWYGQSEFSSVGVHSLTRLNANIFWYSNHFRFNSGLHTGGDGKVRYFDSNLNKITGWQTINGKIYYFGSDGVAATGWQTISSKTYYFNSDGAALKGWWTISSTKYFFGASGELATQCRTVYLQSAMNTSKTIDIHGGYVNTAGTQAQIWSLNNGINQRFFVWTSNNTDWYIQNESSGMVLDIEAGNITNEQAIIQWPIHGGVNQKWRLVRYTDGTTMFRSAANTNYCIDIYGSSTTDGAKLILWSYKATNNANQRFYAGG